MTDPVPSKVCHVCDTPDGDHLDWCTPQAREQRPSKDEVWSDARVRDELRDYDLCLTPERVEQIFRQALGLIDRQREQIESLSIHAEKWVKRALTPAHEREGPHCSTCGCGLAPEPAVTLTLLRQLAEEYIETLGQYPVEGYATPREYAGSELSRFFAWLRMSSGFAVRAAQPPGGG